MNVLFLSLLDFDSFHERNIYSDYLRQIIKNGYHVYCISPVERRKQKETELLQFGSHQILKLKIGNIQKVNLIEKGISTLNIELLFIRAIKFFFADIKFDLVLYATPPITFANVIRFVKKRDDAKSYLMLKDIFPQNSVDLGMLRKTGIKGFVYRYFRAKEKKLYALSDRIGCMSHANKRYLLENNPDIPAAKVEICPNCIEVQDIVLTEQECRELRCRYGIPQDKIVFIYGGNLGKPQDVPFIVDCLKACADIDGISFVIAGSGTDRHILETYVKEEKPCHVQLLGQIPKDEYDKMVACCDIGLIFLDHRFSIPNFPSRLLSYMQAELPVLASTDRNTDIGDIIVAGGFGWWCESTSAELFRKKVFEAMVADRTSMGKKSKQYLRENYNVESIGRNIDSFLKNHN